MNKVPSSELQDDIESSRAPLIDHLIELRSRLIKSLLAFVVMFVICFSFSEQIFNILVRPYTSQYLKPEDARLIFTQAFELFFTHLKVGAFGAMLLAFPVIASQIYKFVAPGLYKHEKQAFLPYLIATPILFILGILFVYFVAMPLLMRFSFNMQQLKTPGAAVIEYLPKVSEYLSIIMTLIFAFGICFQTPIVLMLLSKVGVLNSEILTSKRRYAILIVFIIAAVLTPPDPFSQIALAVPMLLLYEISIFAIRMVEKKRAAAEVAREVAG